MAKNKIILTAGEAIKREARLLNATNPVKPGMFVMPTTDTSHDPQLNKSTGVVTVSDGTTKQFAVVDLSSINGMAWETTGYVTGDQIPILYPTNGCIVNVLTESAAAIAIGTPVKVSATGFIVTASAADAIGVANEDWNPADYVDVLKKIKVEVLK